SAPLVREIGDRNLLAMTLGAAAMAAGQRADDEQAKELWIEALGLWRDLGNRTYTVLGLAGLAQVAEVQGDQERAARLFGAAEAQVPAVGAKQFTTFETLYPALYRAIMQESVPANRLQHDNPIYQAAWADGGTM